jgi:hypothetical protein
LEPICRRFSELPMSRFSLYPESDGAIPVAWTGEVLGIDDSVFPFLGYFCSDWTLISQLWGNDVAMFNLQVYTPFKAEEHAYFHQPLILAVRAMFGRNIYISEEEA